MAIGSTRKHFSIPVKAEMSMVVCPTFLKDSEHLEELKRIPSIQSMYSKKNELKGDLRDIKHSGDMHSASHVPSATLLILHDGATLAREQFKGMLPSFSSA